MKARILAATLFLCFATALQADSIAGKWIGTNHSTTVYCNVPPTSTGGAELDITQTGDAFTGTFLWMWANPNNCIPSPTIDPYLLDIAGTVNGTTFQAAVFFPGAGEIGTMTGSVSGTSMSFTFIIPTDEEHDAYPEELIDTIVTATDLKRVVPPITTSVGVGSLWPPNHSMVDIGLTSVTDGSATTTFVVYSDEEAGSSPDASGALLLRAERAGQGDGRVYLIVVTATDSFSSMNVSCQTVVVPKSQSERDIASVNAQAAAALSQCPSPGGYFVIAN